MEKVSNDTDARNVLKSNISLVDFLSMNGITKEQFCFQTPHPLELAPIFTKVNEWQHEYENANEIEVRKYLTSMLEVGTPLVYEE